MINFLSLFIYVPKSGKHIQQEFPAWVYIVVFFVPIIWAIYWGYTRSRKNKALKKGVFLDKLPGIQDNILEAYVCLAVVLIQLQKNEAAKKVKFVNQFFSKYFDIENKIYSSVLYDYYNGDPIHYESVVNWLNKSIQESDKRAQILFFLVGIAILDGEIIPKELTFLQRVAELLGIEKRELDQIIDTQFYRRAKNKQQSSSHAEPQAEHILSKAFLVLGLNGKESIDEIKSIYRNLAKTYHPDRYATESQVQQQMAHERFVAIQEAYELVMKTKHA